MIYICIPTYDEERTIGVLLWKIRQVMAEFPRDYQILVVDDASADATSEILAPYTRILPLTVMRNDERKGYAASLEMLLREAVSRSPYPKRDAVVTLQADFTEEPDEIPTLVKRIEGGADVVASEVGQGLGQAPRLVRWARRVLGYLLRRRAAWPEAVSDPLSGFRAYRVITLKKALDSHDDRPLLELDGWAANAALLQAVSGHARRVEVAQVTLRYDRRRRTTRFRPLEAGRDVVRFLRSDTGTNDARGANGSGGQGGAGRSGGTNGTGGASRGTRAKRQPAGTVEAGAGSPVVRKSGTRRPGARKSSELKSGERTSGERESGERESGERESGERESGERKSEARGDTVASGGGGRSGAQRRSGSSRRGGGSGSRGGSGGRGRSRGKGTGPNGGGGRQESQTKNDESQ